MADVLSKEEIERTAAVLRDLLPATTGYPVASSAPYRGYLRSIADQAACVPELIRELEAARELIERERVFRQLIGDALKRGEAVPWAIACVDLSPPTEEDARRGRELAAQHGWEKHLDFAYDAARKEPA